MTATAKSNATAVTLSSPTYTSKDLTVDQWFEVSFAIEDKEAVQVAKSFYAQERMAKNMSYELASKLEIAIAGIFDDFSSTSIGTTGSDLTDAMVRAAISTLAAVGINLGECAFFIYSAVVWDDLMGVDKFTLAINSPEMSPVGKGKMGNLYGIPLYASNFVQSPAGGGRFNVLASKDAIHYATSSLPVMAEHGSVGKYGIRVQSSYDHRYLATLTTADILYGVLRNRHNGGVCIKTDS